MFVVFHSRNQIEFVDSHDKAKALKNKYSDGLCKKITAVEKEYWKERVAQIPKLRTDALAVYACGNYYSDQDHDRSATIGVVFKKFVLTEPTLADGSHGVALASIVRALEVAPPMTHLNIYTDSLFFLFAIHYGFRNYPKLQPSEEYPFKYLWKRIEFLMMERASDGTCVCFDYAAGSKNLAHGPACNIISKYMNDWIIHSISTHDLFVADHFRNFANNVGVEPN